MDVVFNAIVSRLIALKTLKSQNVHGCYTPESSPGLCTRPQAAITIALQLYFPF